MSAPDQPTPDVTFRRLEDQITWYDSNATKSQKRYKWLKVAAIVFAAVIPALAGSDLPWPHRLTGLLGVLIVVIEGIQQVYQFQANWLTYRSTSEGLKHEKFLYLAQAGPYSDSTTSHQLLAEKIESLVSQEHARWTSGQTSAAPKTPAPADGHAPFK